MSFPSGWSQEAVDAVAELADRFGSDPADILGLFNSESGLYPKCGIAGGGCKNVGSGYFGLIQGNDGIVSSVIGTSWSNLVGKGTTVQQLAAIEKFWHSLEKGFLGESISARADKLDVSPAAVLYSLNFVPAYFKQMKSGDQPMIISADYAKAHDIKLPANDGGAYYKDNPGFDTAHKGYITVRDVDARIARMRDQGASDSRTRDLFAAVPASYDIVKAGGSSSSSTNWWLWGGLAAFLAAVGGVTWYYWPRSSLKRALAMENPRPRRRRSSHTPGQGHSQVQSLLFPRDKFTPSEARHWATSHGYRASKVHVTADYIRLRQRAPRGEMRTVPFGSSGIKAIVEFV